MLASDTHFLLVDDYENVRNLLSSQLKELGMENVSLCENANDAIQFIQDQESSNPVRFIVSDWNMPGKTGLEFLKWVRAQDSFKDLPFLILTTENEQAKILDAIQNGVSNFLLKPWQEEDIVEKIKLCWEKHHS